MKKRYLTKSLSLLCCMLLLNTATIIAQDFSKTSAASLVKQHAVAIGISISDLQNFRISDAYTDKRSGLTLVYVQQTFKGSDVLNSIQTVAFRNGKFVTVAGGRINNIETLANTKEGKAAILPDAAIRAAATHLKLAAPSALSPLKPMNEKKEIEYGDMGISSVNIKSKLTWVPLQEEDQLLPIQQNKLFLCWQVTIQPKGQADYWLVNVDALKGTVINKINLNVICDWKNAKQPYTTVAHDYISSNTADEDNTVSLVNRSRYRVIAIPAESPIHSGGTPTVLQNPWTLAGAGNAATTLQWQSDGTTTFDSTRGNNVLSQEDVNGNNGFGRGAHSTTALPNLTFSFAPKFNKPPTLAVNQNFALTNLFYINNVMHDVSYQYGFDEVAGNFQANNQGRGGTGNDYVFADAQDGSGTSNANFSTPSDGGNPRMQMFQFSGVPVLTVKQPASYAGVKASTEGQMSTNNKLSAIGPISGTIVLYQDNASGTIHEACGAAFNAAQLAGKIALLDRGTCGFTSKVKNAQNAGAIGVIVADNIAGEYPIIMGGTDNTITIPAVMVSKVTGDSMKLVLASAAISITLAVGPNLDGDIDNGVISHEYTHGISNRLTGGPNNVSCLGNKEEAGEGWSDYLALMLTTNWATATINDGPNKRPIGTYVLGQGTDGPGIRFYPYSTSFSVNPWTYDSMTLSTRFANGFLTWDPHVVGEVWCNTIWEMTWELIKDHGIQSNIYNSSSNAGNIVALQLVIEGMKLQPCSPGFVDDRNAILKADTILYGASHSAAIWRAFARRGLGFNASQGSTNNVKDGVADYSLPPGALIAKTEVSSLAAKIPAAGFIISPNPAKDRISISASGNTKALKVYIIDATGKQIVTADLKSSYLQISLPKVAPGVYYVKISGEGVNQTQKIIIQ